MGRGELPEILFALQARVSVVAMVVGVTRESSSVEVAWGERIGMASRSNIVVQCLVNTYGVMGEVELLCLRLGVMIC